MANTLIVFAEKNVSSFCSYSHFCSKNMNVFENTLSTTVDEFVINKLVKPTLFCTTGPWALVLILTLNPYIALSKIVADAIFFFFYYHFFRANKTRRGASNEYSLHIITKTRLYSFDPLKPHFHIVKLGFAGVYIIFLISAQKHRLWYSLEPPRRGGSNEYPQSMF